MFPSEEDEKKKPGETTTPQHLSGPALVQNSSAVTVDCTDTDAVLETIDSVVACAEGVGLQHEYEQQQLEAALRTEEHGLTDREAALVRLQAMERNAKTEDAAVFTFPDIDELNICGIDLVENESSFLSTASVSATASAVAAAYIEAERIADASKLHCAICFDEADDESSSKKSTITFAYLPCCGANGKEETSTTKICTACILLLSSSTSDPDSRIGRCPRCRSWIAVSTKDIPHLSIEAVTNAGQCQICNQTKSHLVEHAAVCDACFLGLRRPLLYECNDCQGRQMIPHPMYRYQITVDDFGTTSWACQGRCQKFTLWRILSDQIRCVFKLEYSRVRIIRWLYSNIVLCFRFIPAGDTPEQWGDNYLEVARARVLEARRGIVELDPNAASGGWKYSCAIM